VRIADIRDRDLKRDLPNTELEFQSLNHDVQSAILKEEKYLKRSCEKKYDYLVLKANSCEHFDGRFQFCDNI
jgi:hypothetical protein